MKSHPELGIAYHRQAQSHSPIGILNSAEKKPETDEEAGGGGEFSPSLGF